MFKQVKKARELQGNEPYKNDEFNILQFILIIIFFIMIAWVTYSNMKVKQQIKDNTPTNNSIVESFQEKEILNNAINDYGYINSKK